MPNVPKDLDGRVSLQYSDKIGIVFATVKGTQASYELKNNDLYVRARIISTKPHPHGYKAKDMQMAWTQPLVAPVK